MENQSTVPALNAGLTHLSQTNAVNAVSAGSTIAGSRPLSVSQITTAVVPGNIVDMANVTTINSVFTSAPTMPSTGLNISQVPASLPATAGTPSVPVPTVASGAGVPTLTNVNSSILSAATSTVHKTPNLGTDTQMLSRQRLQDLVREVDPNEQLDEDVEEMLLQLADDFIESSVNGACQLAKHRKAGTVEVKDVQLHLERNWNMWIPGFGTDELRPYKRAVVTEAHKQRMALIRKALKKY